MNGNIWTQAIDPSGQRASPPRRGGVGAHHHADADEADRIARDLLSKVAAC